MPLKTVVRCYFKTFGDFVTIYSTDVSRGGLVITSSEQVAKGQSLRLECKLRNDYPLIMGVGKVVGVQNGGFTVNFTHLDDDSEKFLNEVVRVKAAEVKHDPSAPKPTFEAKVSQEDVAGNDEFEDIAEVEEIEELEPTEATADPFEEDIFAQPESPAETDFSAIQLNAEEPQEVDDPFGDEPVAVDDPFAGEEPVEETSTGGYEEVESVEPPSVEMDDEFEPGEQSPANPQALFEDIPAEETSGYEDATYAPAAEIPGEAGESTAVFEKRSLLKERRALVIGAGVGVLLLALGGGAYVFLGSDSAPVAVTPPPAPTPAAVAQVMPAARPVTGAAAAATSTVAAAATAVALPQPVAKAEPAKAETVKAPEPKALPVAKPVVAEKPVPVEKPKTVAKPAANLGPAKFVTAVEAYADRIEIVGDGGFDRVKYFSMGEPNRIVVDIYGVGKKFSGLNRPGKGKVARIRPGVHASKIRFVLDLSSEKGKVPAYSLDKEGDRVIVRFQ